MDTDFTDFIDFRISDDDMNAYLTLVTKPNNNGEEVIFDLNEICEYVEMMGVTKGLKKYIVEEMIKKKIYNKEVCIAMGLPPSDGQDGRYEFKINLNPSKKPKILEDGTVDYLNLDLIPSVGKGEVVAEYIPKTDGAPGYDIKGNKLPEKISKDLPPLTGKGFEISQGGLLYIALQDGKVEVNGNKLIISDLYTIRGDVDISTGNINYHGDLEIYGSIRSGMTVKVTGNITVNGTVEAATLEATKDILIKGGVIGGDRAYINAGGCLVAKFIDRAHVIAGDTVHSGTIHSSYVIANKQIVIDGKKGHIIGGRLKATNFISATNIGSLAEVRTEIEVGIDRNVYERQVYLVNESKRIKEDIDKIEKVIFLLDQKNDGEHTDSVKRKLIRSKIEKLSMFNRNKEEIEEIVERIGMSQDAKVEVKNFIYPGATIMIDSYRLSITEENKNVVFLRRGEKIYTMK